MVFGQKLRDQVEERLSFFESGELPRKNIEVMQEAISEYEAERLQLPLTPSAAEEVYVLYTAESLSPFRLFVLF